MAPPDTDRNLLFAVLALQADCLTQERFVEACTLWASRKDTPIVDILAERGWLTPDDRRDIERLLERKLRKHSGDAKAAIAEVTSDAHLRRSLDAVPDPDIRATLVGSGPVGHVLLETVNRTPEEGERYTVTRLHATGGIGRVWLARDGTLGRDVALKDLRPERAANPAVWGRFLREAQITGRLEHPGIVPIYELGHRAEGQPFYTMRFVRGKTLREAILAYHQKRERGELGALDLRELLTAFVGVCNAIAYAHSQGVIHRDLKPANVVMGEFGEVMVLDWGLAKETRHVDSGAATTDAAAPPPEPPQTGDMTHEGQVLGTPAYMAPEQADGRIADIDARTDVYGLGAILYDLLTGRPPFTGQSTEDVLSRVRTLAPERPRDCVPGTPRALDAICLKALAKRPEDRFLTAKAMADDVLRFQADEPITAYREPLTTRAWRWARRHRSLVTSLVAALVIAVPILVVGMVLVNRSENRERDARRKEEIARKEEAAARERAQANYQRTLRAADALAEELARGIRPIAGTQSKTVLEILNRTKQISDDLFTDPDPPPEVLERRAKLLVQFSELYRQTNRSVLARESAEQAIALLDRLLASRPDDRGLRIERGQARNRLGWVLFDQGHLDESLAAFRASRAELEAIGAGDDPVLAAVFLASDYTFEGNILSLYGDRDGAEKVYRRGLDIRHRAVAASKGDLTVRTQLALSLERYGRYLVMLRSGRNEEGLRMLREGRAEMEAACAADPADTSLHIQLVRLLTNIAEGTLDEAEAAGCVDAGQKVVDRFMSRDLDNIHWQREDLRLAFYRVAVRLKNPGALDKAARRQLRQQERKVLEEMLAVIVKRNAQDPENYIWLSDVGNMSGRLAQAHLNLARDDPPNAAEHLTKARELARAAIEDYRPILSRAPLNTETEINILNPLYNLRQIEKERKDVPAALAAGWEYDALQIGQAQRLVAAHPQSQYWQSQLHRSHYQFGAQWVAATRPENAEFLVRPEVIQSLLRLAAVVADVPAAMPKEFRDEGEPIRKKVATLLRELDAKGVLPPEGKAILAKLPPADAKK